MFKKIIAAAMALTLCTSGMAAANTGFAKNFAPTAITANAAFQSYVKAFPAGTKLYTSPTSGVVAQTLAQGGSFTIVEEQTVGTNVYGKFKSGAGWAIVRTVDPTPQTQVPFTQYFDAGTRLYTSPTSGVVAMTLTQGSVFTIVEVQTVNGVKYGKFKSGAGWAVLDGQPPVVPVNTGYIKKADIDAVCNKYNYKNDRFWTTKTVPNMTTCKTAAYSSGYNGDAGTGWHSFSYLGCSQCYGFADYVMANVASNKKGSTVELYGMQRDWAYGSNHNGFIKYSAATSGGLKIGDIVRGSDMYGNKDQHSAIVYDIAANGNITFLECWGSSGRIKFSSGFSGNNGPHTFEQLVNQGIYYILRYEG